MGGSFKRGGGGSGGSGGGGGGNKRRSYGIILLVAFGAAILGVMAIHKLRERRIFNLMIKDKDQQLLSLQLLLQKESDMAKGLRSKREEMQTSLLSCRTQTMELNGRVLEMQSTISSLKDEQRALESALEEKQNEIKLLRGKEIAADQENARVTTLTGILKQKEAEIEQLKNRIRYPDRNWSLSSNDPSNPSSNLTARSDDSTHKGVIRNESNNNQGGQSEGNSENVVRREMAGEEVRHSKDEENTRGLEGELEHKNSTTQSEETDPERRNEAETKRDEEDEASQGVQQNPVSSGNVEGQKTEEVSREVNTKERTVNPRHDGVSKGRGHKNLSRTKGQRWRMIARKRGLEHVTSIKAQRTSQRDNRENAADKLRSEGSRIRNSNNHDKAVVDERPRARDSFTEPKLLKTHKKEENVWVDGNIENGRLQAKSTKDNEKIIEENIHQKPEEDIINKVDIPERFDTEMDEDRDEYKEETDESEF